MAGFSRLGALRVIALRLVKPTPISAYVLVCIFVLVEIRMTILLYSPETETMSVVMFRAMETSGVTRGFTIGTVQTVVISCGLAIAYRFAGNVRPMMS
jgi:ABC-type Fe3+ transport system permease subunit